MHRVGRRLVRFGVMQDAPGPAEGAQPAPGAGPRRLRVAGPAPELTPAVDIVVGVNRDPASQQALMVAADLARRLHAHLHVVHVVDLGDYPIDPDASDWEQRAQATLAQEREHVRTELADQPGSWTYHAWHGDPVGLLAAVADEHDALFIVVGTRGAGFAAGLSRLLSGSTSHGLIRRRHHPVLIVPQPRHA